MKIKFYLKRPKATNDTVVYAAVSFESIRIKYYTDLHITPKYWNSKSQLAREPNAKGGGGFITSAPEFNVKLRAVRSTIEAVAYRFSNSNGGRLPTKNQLIGLLDKEFGRSAVTDNKEKTLQSFWGYFNDFIDRCESGSRLHLKNDTPLAANTVKNLKNLKAHLRNFEKWRGRKLDFDSFDLAFHKAFTDYLTKEKGLQINTIGKLITNTKVLLQEALEDGKNKFTQFQHRKFKSYSVESDQIYLTNNEINEIWLLELGDNQKLQRVRDMFVLGCFTGLRHSDLKKLSGEHLVNEMIVINQTKTSKPVIIPARKIVKDIFVKYDGKLPSMSNQKFNKYLKDLCGKCPSLKKTVSHKTYKAGKKVQAETPKYMLVSSHCMRRSFATNEYLAEDLTVTEIRSITGHKSEKAFFKYLRMTPKENADNIARKFAERDKNTDTMYVIHKAS